MSEDQAMDELDFQILREFQKLTETQKKAFITSIPLILALAANQPKSARQR